MSIVVFGSPPTKQSLGRREISNDARKLMALGAKESINQYAEGEIAAPITLGLSGGIWQGTGTFDSPTTGLKIWHDSGIGRIAGWLSGDLQWYADTNGVFFAGAGNVQLSKGGIAIAVGPSAFAPAKLPNSLRFDVSSGGNLAYIYGYYVTVSTLNGLDIVLNQSAGFDSTLKVQSDAPSGKSSTINFVAGDATVSFVSNYTTRILSIGTSGTPVGVVFNGYLSLPVISTLTIAAGVVTITGSRHLLETEAAAATDNLDTINGGTDEQLLILSTVSNARDVVVKHMTGNIRLSGGADRTLTATSKRMVLMYDSTAAEWVEWNLN